MKYLLLICLTLIALLNARQIFLSDCDGGMHFYPKENDEKSLLYFNPGVFRELNTIYEKAAINRIQCECPGATRNEIKQSGVFSTLSAYSPGFYVNAFNTGEVTYKIGTCDFNPYNITGGSEPPYFPLPSTCQWGVDEECLFSVDVGSGVEFDVAIATCPDSEWVFASVDCSGPACDSLGMPCTDNSECEGGNECTPLIYNETALLQEDLVQMYYEALDLSYSLTDPCFDHNAAFNDFVNHIRDTFWNAPSTYTDGYELAVCSPPASGIDLLNSTQLMLFLNESTNILSCNITYEYYYECNDGSRVSNSSDCPEVLPYCCYDMYLPIESCNPGSLCCEYGCSFNDTTFQYDCSVCEQPDYFYQSSSIVSITDCTGLNAWDGAVTGGNVRDWMVDHPFRDPVGSTTPLTDGAKIIFQSTCDGTFSVLPDYFKIYAETSLIEDHFAYFYDLYRGKYDCEATEGGFTMDDSIFATQFFLPTFFSLMTTENREYFTRNLIPIQTWFTQAFNENTTLPYINTPDSCSYESWRDNDICAFSYDGLMAWLGIDVTLNVKVDKCDFRDFPSIYIECEGDDCGILTGIVSCDPTDYTTCPNARCMNIAEYLEEFEQATYGYADFDQDYVKLSLGINSTQCPASDTTEFVNDINKALALFDIAPNSHVCLPSYMKITQHAQGWASMQYHIEANGDIVLSNVRHWEPKDFVDPTDSPTATADAGLLKLSAMILLAIFMLF